MELVRNASASFFETVSGWAQSPHYRLMFPEFKPPHFLAWREKDGEISGLSASWEVWCWASLGLDVIGSRLWKEEHLQEVFKK
jgi:hypothetical protein